jgi:ATP-dependent exoDNAse (exonuclease V) beta subunit
MAVKASLLGAVLDPLSVPLAGRVAIEASAGTGKTFTITQLYLRLVLERGFGVREILVVTYTKAATAELRDRIRKALAALRDALRTGETSDEFLRALLARLADRPAALAIVDRALTGFDEAAIFTIHGFCQRVLAERAFESGVAFDLELVPDQRELAQEVVDDFWRRELYGARPTFVRHVLEKARLTPEVLARLVQDHAGRPYRRIDAPDDPVDVATLEGAFEARRAELRDAWARDGAAVEALTSPALKRSTYRVDGIPERCRDLAGLVAETSSPALPEWFGRFTTSGIIDGTKVKNVPPSHAVFDACERFRASATALAAAYDARVEALRARAIRFATAELGRRKRDRGVQHYDDLVAALERALAEPRHGRALADALRARYGAALIDEFQDTDPFQYEIVRRIYGDSDAPVFLVGDPKQAIYAFRGADVFTYVRAREEAETVSHLERNWRSTPALVTAVNALFDGPDEPFVLGAIAFVDAVAAAASSRWWSRAIPPSRSGCCSFRRRRSRSTSGSRRGSRSTRRRARWRAWSRSARTGARIWATSGCTAVTSRSSSARTTRDGRCGSGSWRSASRRCSRRSTGVRVARAATSSGCSRPSPIRAARRRCAAPSRPSSWVRAAARSSRSRPTSARGKPASTRSTTTTTSGARAASRRWCASSCGARTSPAACSRSTTASGD